MRSAAFKICTSVIGLVAAQQATAQSTSPEGSGGTAAIGAGKSSSTSSTDTGTAATSESVGLQDIIVTAQKRSESINKVGISINAVSGDALEASGITSTADLGKVVSGFNFTPSAYGTPVYTLRGIGFYDTSLTAAPTVSLYVDEVPLPLSIMSTAATLDVERVEVLKGPQGTLFGQNSTGGAINYIAAKPTADLHYGAEATYGRFDRGGASGFISGPLSSTLRARLALRWDHSGDWQYSYTRDARRGEGNVFTGRLLLDWTPTDRLTFSLNANGFKDRSDNQGAQLVSIITPNAPALLKAFPLPPRDPRATDWDPGRDFRRNLSFYQVSLRSELNLSDEVRVTSLTSYNKLTRENEADVDGTSLPNFAVTTPGSSEDFSQELRLSGAAGRFHYVLGGNYAYDSITDQASVLDGRLSTLPVNSTVSKAAQKVDTYAAFGNLDYQLLEGVTLTGGLRYTDQKRVFTGCTYDSGNGQLAAIISGVATKLSGQAVMIPPGGCTTLGTNFLPGVQVVTLHEDNLSWKAGVNWEVNPTSLLYANISRGYKGGAFPSAGATYVYQLAPAVQESVLAYEAGYKLTLFNRTLQFNGAGFYYDYSNKQLRGKLFNPQLGPLNALVNVPKSRIYGAELQATWRPVRGLTINGGATYTDTKITGNFYNYNAIVVLQQMQGQRLPLTPRWQANAGAQYEADVGRGLRATIGGNINHQSSTNGGLGEVPLLNIPAYTLADARVGLGAADDSWRVSLFVQNLTDKYYITSNSLPGPDAIVSYTGLPRTFGITVSFRR